jgi:hypothetical protein
MTAPSSSADAADRKVHSEKRAALIERDTRAPRAWAEALARLDRDHPPGDVPLRRWRLFIDDCGHFLDHGWAAEAERLGWTPLELFGCDRERPFARIDRAGLLWLLNGETLVDLAADRAIVEMRITSSRQSFYRKPAGPGCIPAWELTPAPAEPRTLTSGQPAPPPLCDEPGVIAHGDPPQPEDWAGDISDSEPWDDEAQPADAPTPALEARAGEGDGACDLAPWDDSASIPTPPSTPANDRVRINETDEKSPAFTDLRAAYEERAAIMQFDGGRSRAKAEEMAWLAIAGAWWAAHGTHTPPTLCAGCGKPLSGAEEVLRLPHGERCHLDNDYRCVIAFGWRWKRQTGEALEPLGIPTPPGVAA